MDAGATGGPGPTSFTFVDDGSAGISAEVGVEVGVEAQAGVAEIDVGAEASAALTAEIGDTWIVPTTEADDFDDQLYEEIAEDVATGSVPFVGGLLDWVVDRVNGEVRDPDIQFIAGGVETGASAEASADVFGEQVAGAEVAVEGAVKIGTEQDRSADKPESEWTDTDYFEVSLGVSGEIGLLTAQASGEMGTTQIMKVTRDLDGEIQSVEFVSSVTSAALVGIGDLTTENLLQGGENTSVVQTTTLLADDDADREILETWLAEGSHPDFREFVDERSQISVLEYDGDEFGLSLGGEVALGAKLGLSASVDTLQKRIRDGIYYGPPDSGGSRTPVRFDSCLNAL